MAPQATFDGQFLYGSLEEMAAVYWFHLTANHGFIDGNKRVGLRAADVFLMMNGLELTLTSAAATATTLSIANGSLVKEALIEIVRANVRRLTA